MEKIKLGWILCISTLVIAGCGNKQTADDAHPAHGPEPFAYTVYSDSTELFVEFEPLVVGQLTSFAAHFTVMGELFTPLTQGTVTVSLIMGDKGIRTTAEKPVSPGIYKLALQPAVAGTGKLVFEISSAGFNDKITIENVVVFNAASDVTAQTTDTHDEGDIVFLKEQAWQVEFASIPLQTMTMRDVIKTSGLILPAPGDEMIITATASGIVQLAGSKIIAGNEVNAGTPLFNITGGALTQDNMDVALANARSAHIKAKADYDRASVLFNDDLISQSEFQQAQLDYETARTLFENMNRNYSQRGQSIRAPGHGYIKQLLVDEGRHVDAGDALAVVSKNKKLMLQAQLSQAYFRQLPTITAANFKTANDPHIYSTDLLNGKMISYGRSTTTAAPFIPVTFEIDNTGNLLSGSPAEVYLLSKSKENVAAFPATALMEEQGNFYVYVQTGGESFSKRKIKTGMSDGLWVEVLEGLRPGERVVTRGAYQIKLTAAGGTVPAHGHSH